MGELFFFEVVIVTACSSGRKIKMRNKKETKNFQKVLIFSFTLSNVVASGVKAKLQYEVDGMEMKQRHQRKILPWNSGESAL